MNPFDTAAGEYMTSPAQTIPDTASLAEASERLDELGISGAGVVDRTGGLVGVVTRTDLLRVGRMRRRSDGRPRKLLSLPAAAVREFMAPTVEIIAPDRPIREAAERLLQKHIHRLFISEDRRPRGVLSATELMRAVADAGTIMPIGELMHGGVISIQAHEPVSLAVDRMNAQERTGIVVAEQSWPVGVFTQAEALAARDAPADDRVDQWMDPRVICLPLAMPVHRAAEQALVTLVRRVLAVDGEGVRGILTPLDFARVVRGR